MEIRLALYRLLLILAIVGLALAPLPAFSAGAGDRTVSIVGHSAHGNAAVATTAAMAMAGDMPCCPPDYPVKPDCNKACPLASLCFAKCVGRLIAADIGPFRIGLSEASILRDEAAPDGLAQAPPPRPPRA